MCVRARLGARVVAGGAQTNEEAIRKALAAAAAKHNATALAEMAVRAFGAGAGGDLTQAETARLAAFDSETAALKAVGPAAHAEARSRLHDWLRRARAAAVGRAALNASLRSLETCAGGDDGAGAGPDGCVAAAQSEWRAVVAAALGSDWSLTLGTAAASAGEAAAMERLTAAAAQMRVDAEQRGRAVAGFRECQSAGGVALEECARRAAELCGGKAECVARVGKEQADAEDFLCEVPLALRLQGFPCPLPTPRTPLRALRGARARRPPRTSSPAHARRTERLGRARAPHMCAWSPPPSRPCTYGRAHARPPAHSPLLRGAGSRSTVPAGAAGFLPARVPAARLAKPPPPPPPHPPRRGP
jgi:hypothetical protein